MVSVAVIGAGIAGLTAAHKLYTRGLDVTVFEASDHVGGAIRSERRQGYLVEHGPNTLQRTTPPLERLISHLDLESEVIMADERARNRYIVRDGTPRLLPTSPASLITTPLLSVRAKLRLLCEPFIPPAPRQTEESVASFTRRRLGHEMLDYGIDPLVGGIFAGDPQHLSLPHAFPRLYDLEQEHGSLIKGQVVEMLRKAKSHSREPAPRRGSFTFRDGLTTLPEALAGPLKNCIRRSAPVTGLTPEHGRWRLEVDGVGSDNEYIFDVVVCAMPTHRFGDLGPTLETDVAPLADIEYPPVAVVALGYRRSAVAHPLDGFGALVPRVERDFGILGTLFTSSLFPDRAPDGHVLLTSFVGGARHPQLARMTTEQLVALVTRDLKRLLHIGEPPSFVHAHMWPHAIPQYTLGYGDKKARIDDIERQRPGLFFAGNYRRGISVADTVASAHDAVRRIVKQFVPRGVAV